MMRRALIYLGIVIFVGIFVVAIENPFESRVAKNADLPLCSGYPHRYSDVGLFERRSIVYAVAGDGDDVTSLAQLFHYSELVFRRNSRIHGHLVHDLG